jgi:hypothetical protein
MACPGTTTAIINKGAKTGRSGLGNGRGASSCLLFGGISLILLFTVINLAAHKSAPATAKTVGNFENKALQSMNKPNDTILKPLKRSTMVSLS